MRNIGFTLYVLFLIGFCLSVFGIRAEASSAIRSYTESPLVRYDISQDFESMKKNTAAANGTSATLETPPIPFKSGSFMPLRFISEYYGFKVDWDPKPRIVFKTASKIKQISSEVPAVEVPVLMYHTLVSGRNDSISIDPAQFKEQMLALKSAGYTSITENDLLAHLEQGAALPKNPVLITFDDGYISTYTEAFPVLKKLEMKASIYVITSRIFETHGFTAGEYEKISWQQAREMTGTMSIQSHTWDSHLKLKNFQGQKRGLIASRLQLAKGLETQEAFEERVYADFAASKNAIEKNTGAEVTALSYPYGDYTADTIRLAEKAGFKMAFTVRDGVNRQSSSPFELMRITVSGEYSGKELIETIESH